MAVTSGIIIVINDNNMHSKHFSMRNAKQKPTIGPTIAKIKNYCTMVRVLNKIHYFTYYECKRKIWFSNYDNKIYLDQPDKNVVTTMHGIKKPSNIK